MPKQRLCHYSIADLIHCSLKNVHIISMIFKVLLLLLFSLNSIKTL